MRTPFYTEYEMAGKRRRLFEFVANNPVFTEEVERLFSLSRIGSGESFRTDVTHTMNWQDAAVYILGQSLYSYPQNEDDREERDKWIEVFSSAYGIIRQPVSARLRIWREFRAALHCLRYGTEISRQPKPKRSPKLELEIT